MKEVTLEVLRKIYEYGYEAYAVGGYVRDMLLNINSQDIDLTTNATPMELKNIFADLKVRKEKYGATTLIYKKVRFEITTYRKEGNYVDNRHPEQIQYVNDLKTDLLRRDFTINTICMDKDGNIVDLLNGCNDLEKKIIKTVNNSDLSFQDDSLRILRAIRFATVLDFQLSTKVVEAIKKNKYLLLNLSAERKKYELDHIFVSKNVLKGISYLKEFDLLSILNLENIDRVRDYSDLIGIWAMIDSDKYKFTNSEKQLINKVNEVYKLDNLNANVLYKYGLYVNVLAGLNKGLNKKQIVRAYDKLIIKNREEIKINALKICDILKRKPDRWLNEVYEDLEYQIIMGNLANENEIIIEYIRNKFSY